MYTSKVCPKCKTQKPLSEFYRDKATSDGHKHKCKSCCYGSRLPEKKYNPFWKLDDQRNSDVLEWEYITHLEAGFGMAHL